MIQVKRPRIAVPAPFEQHRNEYAAVLGIGDRQQLVHS